MARARTNIRKILVPALVSLLLCGIVVGKLPELVSLSDNTANDFAIRRTDSVASRPLLGVSRQVRAADIDSNICVPELHFSPVNPLEKTELVPSNAFFLHSALRT
jgi:hypothetical protein